MVGRAFLITALCLGIALPALGQTRHVDCSVFPIEPDASLPMANAPIPPAQACGVRTGANGLPLPDATCTPGAINPTVTLDVLTDPRFRTSCIRDQATTAHEKAQTYAWYSAPHPVNNRGQNQTCELDHLISLELGGADTLDNIWPECGPDGVTLNARYFKIKDIVENYLAAQVRGGSMTLEDAQRGIAADWTQYLNAACASNQC